MQTSILHLGIYIYIHILIKACQQWEKLPTSTGAKCSATNSTTRNLRSNENDPTKVLGSLPAAHVTFLISDRKKAS